MLAKLPFVGLLAKDADGQRPMLTKLIENAMPGVIVGVLVAIMTVYMNDAKQDYRLSQAEKRLESLGLWVVDASTQGSVQAERLARVEATLTEQRLLYALPGRRR